MRYFALFVLLAFALAVQADGYVPAPEKTGHWAWKAPARPGLPAPMAKEWVQNPIDAFILAKLENAGLKPAAPAARAQLIRRVTFDLIGLPPTPAELDAFLKDASVNAWEMVVDRLLASPHYGERWGRHWLDLVRFAESNGYEQDEIRPDAWRYRDYVIQAFNSDKPYNRFLEEQLAGDELFPDDAPARVATAFNLLGPDMTDAANKLQRRQNSLDDMTDTTGLVFLGLTIGCARCHDHKFEPIPQTDFYRMQAFFAPATFRKDFSVQDGDPAAKTFLLRRGELSHPGQEIEPGFPIIFSPGFEAKAARVTPLAKQTTGRRAALAHWLTEKDNPLTARVMVNRLWQHHFGRGIVPTPNDFGLRGQMPTHPDLLDWMAREFAGNGWSMKHMHKLMLLSATYQQSTQASRETLAKDPGNDWFSRMNRLRLEGEIIRDSLLALSGRLNLKMGGPGVFPPLPPDMVIRDWKVTSDPAEHTRRSVYLFAKRNVRFPFLEPFDLPDTNQSCPKRERSTTAPQALALLNNQDVMAAAQSLANRLQKETDSREEQIRRTFRLTVGRLPSQTEMKFAREFLDLSPLAEFCRTMFNVNEFVYLD